MTVTPLVSRIKVLSKGTEYIDRGTIPFGGHIIPKSTVGDSEES